MAEPARQPDDEAKAFLRELVDSYGVEGLIARFSAAIQEAEAGRVAGPALDKVTAWVKQEHGEHLQGFGGGHLSLSAGPALAAAAGGTAFLTLGGQVARPEAEFIVKVADDVATITDRASVTAHVAVEASGVVQSAAAALPTNMEVMILAHDAFLYLCGAWGIVTQMPVQAYPFVLLMTLAIVIVRVRLRQAKGSTEG